MLILLFLYLEKKKNQLCYFLFCFQCGIYVVYYLDYTIGGGWWIMVLYLIQIGAVFIVRGRPHTGDVVVGELFPPNSGGCLRHWAGPLLSFIWNVVMPITLVVSNKK